jgi:hypothetical protein
VTDDSVAGFDDAMGNAKQPKRGEWPVPAARLSQTWHRYGRFVQPPGPVPGVRVVRP